MFLVIDLDSTIINTSKSIINLHNKLNQNKIIYQENHGWDFSPMVTKEQLPELFKLFDHNDFYGETLVVFDNAIEIINELSMQNKIIICSKHQNSRKSITRKWVYETFPSVDLVFTDTFDKSCVGKCDIAIDDKPEALNSVDAKCKILYGSYSWNQNWNGFRVNNWQELKKFIDKLQKLGN
jgi:5'(3')-deoxyribonucleotidase